MDSFCLQPVNALSPHPVSRIIQSASLFPALPSYTFHIYLAQSFNLAEVILFLSPLHPECPPLPQLNIAGSCCWFIQAHLKVTPLTVKR